MKLRCSDRFGSLCRSGWIIDIRKIQIQNQRKFICTGQNRNKESVEAIDHAAPSWPRGHTFAKNQFPTTGPISQLVRRRWPVTQGDPQQMEVDFYCITTGAHKA